MRSRTGRRSADGPADARRVVFVSGKGGVGKTSVASAFALSRAREGARVLVVSTDPAHNLGHVWEREVGDDPTRVATVTSAGHVDGVEIDPQATVDRHLSAVGATMRRLLPEHLRAQADRHLALAREAPGTHEAAVVERVAEAVQEGLTTHDLVVFDTAPSGHTLRMMALPEQLTAWTETLLANRDRSDRFGAALQGLGGGTADRGRDAELREVLARRRARFSALAATVTDRRTTAFVLVLTAERLPVTETIDLRGQLAALGVPVAALVVNRRSPLDAGDLLAARHAREEVHLATLRAAVPDVPVQQVPLLAGDVVGEAGLGALADALTGSSTPRW